MQADVLLSVSDLTVRYGALAAVRDVNLEVRRGEIVAIVGPNGAGKSSLLASIAGIVRPAAGGIVINGENFLSRQLEDVVRSGVALVPEGRHIFAALTVLENLMLGATIRTDPNGVRADLDRFFDLFPILGRRQKQPAGQLSGGEQQQLAIARALMSRPDLLMLDEPSLGLAPAIIDQVYVLLGTIREQRVAILVVEQNAERAFTLADRVHVMSVGAFVLSGAPAELAAHPDFDAAYFGIRMRQAATA